MRTLVVDIGGSKVKVWKTGETDKIKIPSGKSLTPEELVSQLQEAIEQSEFERISVGYPGDVRHGHPVADPYNLGPGWVDFDYSKAFGRPVRIMNDACMQALGSYDGGRMLYLGMGTSIGTAFIMDGKIIPLALGHLEFRDGSSFESRVNREALERNGVKRWRADVIKAAVVLKAAFLADYVVLGGGNAKKLEELPEGCRRGGNHNAYYGGLRMWEDGYQNQL